MKETFSKDDTKVMKGIAIILMLMHHLWGFPDRIAGGSLKYIFTIFGQSSIIYLGMFGKICVSLFFFLGGYGIYINSKNKKFDLIGKLKGLYISYWKIFFVFIPIGFFFFGQQPIYCDNQSICTKFDFFSWEIFLGNLTGISSSYNEEWWFLLSYVCALITFPLIKNIIDKHSLYVNMFFVICGSILITNFFPSIGDVEAVGWLNNNYLYKMFFCPNAPYTACFWMGILFAKEDLLVNVKNSLKEHRILTPLGDLLIIGTIIFFRQTQIGVVLDIIYVPFLIVTSLDLLNYVSLVRKMFLSIGKESTNMWLIHSFFCYYFYGIVKVVVYPRWAVVSLILLVIMTYFASIFTKHLWIWIHRLYSKSIGLGKSAMPK